MFQFDKTNRFPTVESYFSSHRLMLEFPFVGFANLRFLPQAFIRNHKVTVDGVRPPTQSLRVHPDRLMVDGEPMSEFIKP